MKKTLPLCCWAVLLVLALTSCQASHNAPAISDHTAAVVTSADADVFERHGLSEHYIVHERYEQLSPQGVIDCTYPYTTALSKKHISSDTPKITYEDVKQIIRDMNGDSGMPYYTDTTSVLKRMEDIQPYPDAIYQVGSGISFMVFEFWPDGNLEKDRRECITVYPSHIRYLVFDDTGAVIYNEPLFYNQS